MQITERDVREILDWFVGRAGDHIPNEHYQRLLVELANKLLGNVRFRTAAEVAEWLYPER